jgi:hypothetical protein
MSTGACQNCGEEVQVAIWDDGILSGAVVLYCYECQNDHPEHTLWDVSALEEAHDEYPGEDNDPNLIGNHPLDEDDEWVVRNRYRDLETYRDHLLASWDGKIPDSGFENVEVPEDECWDLFVWSADDEDAIEEGREYLRQKQEEANTVVR